MAQQAHNVVESPSVSLRHMNTTPASPESPLSFHRMTLLKASKSDQNNIVLFLVLPFAIFLAFKCIQTLISKKKRTKKRVTTSFFFFCLLTPSLSFLPNRFIAIYVCVNQSPLISTLITSVAQIRVFIWIRIGSDCKPHCFLTRPCHTKSYSQLR
jgi:hypothetical protein